MITVCILGATGSIGRSTLDVISRHPERFRLHALTAHSSVDALFAQCQRFHPEVAVLGTEAAAAELRARCQQQGLKVTVLAGPQALCDVAADAASQVVMAAIVGAAGLMPTLSAVQTGKRVLLANKEALVMSGHLFMQAVEEHAATLLPIDSEHNAIFQCLPDGRVQPGVEKILLTGSGGPFRERDPDSLHGVTVEEACNHPNWDMGPKISIDSATMMNKGLELIEACWLFDVGEAQIDIVLHPQSVVHSMVSYRDGSVLAQLGSPDMRTPIAHALAWPERMVSGVTALDMLQCVDLQFRVPDTQRFPCLKMARDAARQGGMTANVMNAANEVAVSAFMQKHIRFTDIPHLIDAVLQKPIPADDGSLASVLDTDAATRKLATQLLHNWHTL